MLPRQGDQLSWGLALSILLHALLLAVLVFWPGLGLSKRQIFAPVYQVNLVGAPRMPAASPSPAPPAPAPAAPKPEPKPAPPKAEPKPAPKPAPKPKEAIATKETAKTKKITRKKSPSPAQTTQELEKKINRLKRQVDEERKAESRLDSALGRLESRVASRGQQQSGAYAPAGGGSRGDQLSLQYQIYYTELWQRIQRQWVLPEAMVEKPEGLVSVVVMRIGKNGKLDKVWLEESSGNTRYDQSCLRAAERAAPYPPLPSGIRSSNLEVGVRFRAEDITG